MANTFDMVNNALMRQLERLDDCNPATDEGKAEIARAVAVKDTCAAAIDNANSTIHAMTAFGKVYGQQMPTPALLGGTADGN